MRTSDNRTSDKRTSDMRTSDKRTSDNRTSDLIPVQANQNYSFSSPICYH